MKNLATELDKLKQDNLFRSRRVLSSAQQIEPTVDGKKVLSFCSNDYLGLANHPKIIGSFNHATKKYGLGSGASHLITGHHKCHAALEKELAEFLNVEKVLLFSTGYMANLGVISAIASRSSTIFADKLNHASLNDAAILSRSKIKRYEHRNTQQLTSLLSQSESVSKFILSDGVFSMDGTVAEIENLQQLADIHNARLLIDDAHGIGVLGKNSKGSTEGKLNENTILVGTLGKAFGTFGAFVAAKENIIEWIIQRANSYIYTTALPPAIAEATRTSLQIIKNESWRSEALLELVDYFKNVCVQNGISISESNTPIQPIMLGSSKHALNVSKQLLRLGILVPAIRPPTVPENTARLRVSLCSLHSKAQIDQLIVAFKQSSIN